MKKFSKLLVLALACASLFTMTACKKGGDTTADGELPTIKLFTAFDSGAELKTDSWVVQKWGEETGVKIDVQSCNSDVFSEKIAAVFAGGNFPDLINYYGDQVTYDKYGDRLFVDINKEMEDGKLPSLKALFDKYPEIKTAMTNLDDGGIYGIPCFRTYDAPYTAWSVREDLLEKAGKSSKGIMTLDELKDMMLTLKEVSGQKYVTSSRLGWSYYPKEPAWIFGSAPRMTFDNKWSYSTNTWVYGPEQQAFKTWVEFMRWMYENEVLHPSFATMTTEELNAGYAEGKFQLCMEQATMLGSALGGNNKDYPGRKESSIYGIEINGEVPKQATMPHYNIGRRWPMTVTKTSENVDAALKAVDWLFSEEGNTLIRYGEEGVHWQQDDRILNGKMTLLQGNYDLVQKLDNGEITQEEYDKYPKGSDFVLGSNWLNPIQDSYMMLGNPITVDEYAMAKYNYKMDTHKAMYDQGIAIEADPILKFTQEEQKEIDEINIPLDTYVSEQVTKFITGALPLDEWDNFVAQTKKMGSGRLVEIYNERYNKSYKK